MDLKELEAELAAAKAEIEDKSRSIKSLLKHIQKQNECNDYFFKSLDLNKFELYPELKAELAAEKAKSAKLVEALKWYANQCPQQYPPDGDWEPTLPPEFSIKAKEALAEYEGDLELIEKTKKAREVLKEVGEG